MPEPLPFAVGLHNEEMIAVDHAGVTLFACVTAAQHKKLEDELVGSGALVVRVAGQSFCKKSDIKRLWDQRVAQAEHERQARLAPVPARGTSA